MNTETGSVRKFRDEDAIPNDYVKMLEEEYQRMSAAQKEALERGEVTLPENSRLRRQIAARAFVDQTYPKMNRQQRRKKVKELRGMK